MPLPPAIASLLKGIPAMPRAGEVGGAGTASVPAPAPGGGGMPGVSPAGPAGAGGGPGDALFSQIANDTLSKGMQSDPGAGLQQLRQCKTILVNLLPKYAMKPGGVDKHIARLFGPLDAAIKAAEEGAQYAGPTAPIDLSAASAAQPGAPGPLPVG